MKQKLLYALWACLFSLCAGLGFIPEPPEVQARIMTVLAVLTFLPPALVLYRAGKNDARLIRNLSALSLGLTVLALIVNFFAVFSPERLGLVLHYVLIIVSSPMICSGHWALSLFLWACLLTASLGRLRK